MVRNIRSKRSIDIEVGGVAYTVDVVEIPFREGVELQCEMDDEIIRFSDRQLGEDDALRLLKEEIARRQSEKK